MTVPTTQEELVLYLQRQSITDGWRIKRLEDALARLATEECPLDEDFEDFVDWMREQAREALYD